MCKIYLQCIRVIYASPFSTKKAREVNYWNWGYFGWTEKWTHKPVLNLITIYHAYCQSCKTHLKSTKSRIQNRVVVNNAR